MRLTSSATCWCVRNRFSGWRTRGRLTPAAPLTASRPSLTAYASTILRTWCTLRTLAGGTSSPSKPALHLGVCHISQPDLGLTPSSIWHRRHATAPAWPDVGTDDDLVHTIRVRGKHGPDSNPYWRGQVGLRRGGLRREFGLRWTCLSVAGQPRSKQLEGHRVLSPPSLWREVTQDFASEDPS
jgi:hypothetical protein